MNLKPIGDIIIVRAHDEEQTTASGIILSASNGEKKLQGTVLAHGDGKILPDGNIIPMTVKAGDVILFGAFAKQDFKYKGEDLLVMHESDVIAIVGD